MRLRSPLFDTAVDEAGQISTLAVLHDYVQPGVCAIDYAVIISDYVWVLELSQEVHLRHQHLLLALLHGAIVQFLPHQNLQRKQASNENR